MIGIVDHVVGAAVHRQTGLAEVKILPEQNQFGVHAGVIRIAVAEIRCGAAGHVSHGGDVGVLYPMRDGTNQDNAHDAGRRRIAGQQEMRPNGVADQRVELSPGEVGGRNGGVAEVEDIRRRDGGMMSEVGVLEGDSLGKGGVVDDENLIFRDDRTGRLSRHTYDDDRGKNHVSHFIK